MVSPSRSDLRGTFPAEWRQVSFICFDLGVMNVIGGAGVTLFDSLNLYYLGFGLNSLWLGLFFILIGLVLFKVHLPLQVGLLVILADAVNTVYFLPKYALAAGVFLVKLSFLAPLGLTMISILRVRLKLKKPRPEIGRFTAIGRTKEALGLLSSMFVSVGVGMAALLLFAKYALPAITSATNPLINIFHDLFLVPALLFVFPLGIALGELIWVGASRFYLSGPQLALFLRHLIQMPFMSKLSEKLTREVSTGRVEGSFSVGHGVIIPPSQTIRRPWRKYLLITSAVLVVASYVAFLVLVYERFAPVSAASEGRSIPGALVVSKAKGGYRSIEAAVADAPTGATIVVRPGVYREVVLIDKEITLIGDQGATIECSEGGCLRIIADKATVRNFTIRARMGWIEQFIKHEQRPAAVVIVGGRAVIEESDISSNRGAGVVVAGADAMPEFRNVRVHDCMLNGILFTNKSQGVVEDSDIYANQWAGIRSERGSNPIIRRSKIRMGKMAGLLLDHGSATVEESEVFENNYAGLHARDGSSISLRKTRSFRNNGNGIFIANKSSGKAEACEVSENKNTGIEVAEESEAQLVDIKVHDQKTHGIVVWHNSTAVVEGAMVYENGTGLFVASGGKPTVRKSVFRSHLYAAIEVQEGGDPTIEESQIYDGKTTGIYFRGGASGRVQHCAVFGNGSSNIIIAAGSDPEISKTRSSESGYAGVLVMDGGQGSVTDCEIFNNYLGIEIRTNSSLSVHNSTIKDNHHHGLVADCTSTGTIKGSRLQGNTDGAWKVDPCSQLIRENNSE